MRPKPSLALRADVDHVRLAGLLRKAHTIAIDTGVAPRGVRQIISDSWQRSVTAGVDPARPAPRMLDAPGTAECLAAHPVSAILPRISGLLKHAMMDSGYLTAFSDAKGILLWSEGSARALASAAAPRFLPGFLCSEDRIGTNAIGTALILDRPVQIFSAEHFNERLHGWTCAAAPIHDPDIGKQIGAIDLSGDFRTAHVHGLALVTAVASAAEGWLAVESRRADEALVHRYWKQCGTARRFSAAVTASGRVVVAQPSEWLARRVEVVPDAGDWPQPDGSSLRAEPLGRGFLVWREGRPRPRRSRLTVAVLGRRQATVVAAGQRQSLHLRHSEIIALLALNPTGMTVRELARALYGAEGHEGTVRGEITRLRRSLGDAVLSRPYRLHSHVDVDVAVVQRRLAAGDAAGAARSYTGPLLPRSTAPGITAERDRLARALGSIPSSPV